MSSSPRATQASTSSGQWSYSAVLMSAPVGSASASNSSRQRHAPTRLPYSRQPWFSTSGCGEAGPMQAPSPSPKAKCSMLKPRYTASRAPFGQA
jgi:hypothetical protein